MIIFAVLALLGSSLEIPFGAPLRAFSIFANDVALLIFGIVAVIGSRYVNKLVWAIVLIVIGFLGGGVGGLLVLVGGILGLVSYALTKH